MGKKKKPAGFTPDIIVLYCQHCRKKDTRIVDETHRCKGHNTRLSVVSCSSKIEESYLLKMLEEGTEGIELVASPITACRYHLGSTRAQKRVKRLRDMLEEISFGTERVGITHGVGFTQKKLIALGADRAEAVKNLGPNPQKV